MIGLLMAWAVVGTEGIPIPYSPRMDDGITVVLFVLFLSVGLCLVTQPQVPAATGEGFPASSRTYQHICHFHSRRYALFAAAHPADLHPCGCLYLQLLQ